MDVAPTPRTLRSKRLRSALYLSADGRCQCCGRELGADWQADHVIPWSVTHRTNVHEMAALCAPCNREKGARMLRKPQQAFQQLCQLIASGEEIDRLYISVVPGGGKSLLPVIAAATLIPKVADALCWVVPRRSLQIQGEHVFIERDKREIIPHTHMIRISTNDVDPCRGLAGYVTTYQALVADMQLKLNTREFDRKRYILVLDEPHHLEEDGLWHAAVAPLVGRAVLTVFMTGTWARGNHKKVAFAPYAQIAGGYALDIPVTSSERIGRYGFVSYSRKAALEEHAIKPLRFLISDGEAKWIGRDGQARNAVLSESTDETADALYTVLNTEYANELLDSCVHDWQAHRVRKPMGKVLVIAPGISMARSFLQHLKGKGILRVGIATSDESDAAAVAIKQYKLPYTDAGALDVLVTVAMAYEGLDVPQITHIALLTHIRSTPWIEQALARGVRVDATAGPYEGQFGYVYAPNDCLLQECIKAIKDEQAPFVKEPVPPATEDGNGASEDGQVARIPIFAQESALTETHLTDIDREYRAPDEALRKVREFQDQHQEARGYDLKILTDLLLFSQGEKPSGTPTSRVVEESPLPSRRTMSPSETEKHYKSQIDHLVKHLEGTRGYTYGTLNGQIKRVFGKSREQMTVPELSKVYAWVQSTYAPPA